ncbi:MupG family TIM beta-alpha barrel fold protein [Bacillus sp. CECT 9360]|uniref:DUF871 domain-containing protein n=1 Tax=Bacillus sp. CECT 9360 TaxID=2845821 RepID=UPI001E57795E|nr:MupG family TIM beta-alpha barrel fold protein [Bacillus sp. CECT 9360]
MLGISVYLGKLNHSSQGDYIKDMSCAGFRSIFTSLHIPEDVSEQDKVLLEALGEQARENEMELMADISPATLKNLGYTYEKIPEIRSLGVTGLRMDYGIPPKVMAELSRKMKISLNASTINQALLIELEEHNIDLSQTEAWHNFYPRPETGLDRERFIQRNIWLKERGFTVMAFIPGDKDLRGPLFQGLPTLEDHRHISPFHAALDLQNNCHIDKVLIGDLSVNNETLSQFSSYQKGFIPIRYKKNQTDEATNRTLQAEHRNRWDQARDVIRSETSRGMAQVTGNTFENVNTVARSKGCITIDNNKYGRYQGELQIALKDLEQDEKVNVVGKVIDEDVPLLPFINGGTNFRLIEI